MLDSTVRLKPCTMFPPIHGSVTGPDGNALLLELKSIDLRKGTATESKKQKKQNKLFFSAGTLLIRHVLGPFLKGSTE